MYQEERIQQMQKLLEQKKRLSKKEIMASFQISSDTARRDILEFLKIGMAVRTHGGIMLSEDSSRILTFGERAGLLKPEKERMAAAVLEETAENSTLFLDVSTTLLLVAQKLNKKCTVYTHSLDNAFALGMNPKIKVQLLGGELNHEDRFFFSVRSLEELDAIKFDVCFIGAASLEEEGILFKEANNALIKQKVVKQSRRVVLVAENQKFSKEAQFKGADYQDIDCFITDKVLTAKQQAYFEDQTEIIFEEESI
ncbi:DeoR family transcriptional regulator [Trichococcus patagoniensis]|uniref:DeoR family transcriptional regulator n=1 Tax=Trichococcus patagoniensis TaxID=382641 RepID=A0A2T5IJ15_9LACT|nr:DeoR/GlpR family DNA-binding transcription regulator [Trichococcus patagoniensis]PTQ83792.1 DeoR family transcriptional regulator [Trichococcus patagoniensis]